LDPRNKLIDRDQLIVDAIKQRVLIRGVQAWPIKFQENRVLPFAQAPSSQNGITLWTGDSLLRRGGLAIRFEPDKKQEKGDQNVFEHKTKLFALCSRESSASDGPAERAGDSCVDDLRVRAWTVSM